MQTNLQEYVHHRGAEKVVTQFDGFTFNDGKTFI